MKIVSKTNPHCLISLHSNPFKNISTVKCSVLDFVELIYLWRHMHFPKIHSRDNQGGAAGVTRHSVFLKHSLAGNKND